MVLILVDQDVEPPRDERVSLHQGDGTNRKEPFDAAAGPRRFPIGLRAASRGTRCQERDLVTMLDPPLGPLRGCTPQLLRPRGS